jgi:O-antigen ligase
MTKIEKAIEACWLAAAFLIPLATIPSRWALEGVEGPKIFLLRSIALLLMVLLAFEWASMPLSAGKLAKCINFRLTGRFIWRAVSNIRRQPIAIAAVAIAAVTVLSTALSPVVSVSIFGIDPGRDSYGLFSIASYLILFGAVATHIKTGSQLQRLVWVVTIASLLLGIFGIEEHFGVGSFPTSPLRISLTFGNPIFGAAYLLLTIPLTIALWQAWATKCGIITHIVVGALLIVLQTTAFVFTLSRGPLLGLVMAFAVFLTAVGLVVGGRAVTRPAASIAIALGIAVAMTYVPVPGSSQPTGQFAERVSGIAAELSPTGGLSSRYQIWSAAADTFVSVPWIDTEVFPEMPDLRWVFLRPMVGYGPDSFQFALSLQGDRDLSIRPWHGHNFIVHTAIELGLLGVIAYVALAFATGFALARMLLACKRGQASPLMLYITLGLTGVFAGRLLEQMGGKAQVSDLTQTWIMIGMVLAMMRIPASQWGESLGESGSANSPVARKKAEGSRTRSPAERRITFREVPSTQQLLRTVAAGATAIVVLVFWWQTVLVHVRADSLAAQARTASEAGQLSKAYTLYRQAVDRSPSSTFPRVVFVQSLIDSSQAQGEPVDQVAMLRDARSILQVLLDRAPLDYRAWSIASKIGSNLASLDPELVTDALRTDRTTAALRPGYRPAQEDLAATLLMLDQYEEALSVVRSARGLASITIDPRGEYLSFIEVLALRGLGRTDEAYPIALVLSERRSLYGLGLTQEHYEIERILSESDRPGAPPLEDALTGHPR